MSRIKLKEYQDTYAEAMAGYGLQRGIDGSVARHISTQEFYRNAIAGQKNLQDNIDELLRIEEQKRQAVERLKQQEQEARTGYEQAKAMREHKTAELEATEQKLKAVKGDLKTEKLKSAAAEVGSNIVEGIGSLVGTSKVKRQEQQIGALRQEVAAHEETIEILQTQMQTMQADHSRRLLEVQQKSQQTIGKLQGEIDRIYRWFPNTPQLIKWGEYCRSIGFSDGQARDLVNMRPVRFSGELYSHEHSQHFEVENSEAQLMRDEKGPGGFQLFIDRIPILRWFRQKGIFRAYRNQNQRPRTGPGNKNEIATLRRSYENFLQKNREASINLASLAIPGKTIRRSRILSSFCFGISGIKNIAGQHFL